MIYIVNKYRLPYIAGVLINIMRGSPLGNPFEMKDRSQEERDRVCDEYAVYISKKIAEKDTAICRELNRIYVLAKQGKNVYLQCCCAPKRCHGDTIKRIIEEKL